MSSKKVKNAGKAAVGCCGNACVGFRDFVLRGNVVDLAVAIVVGGAFKDLVNAFIAAFITPLLGMIGTGDSNGLYFSVNGSKFQYGLFITALLSFLLICLIVYFAIVLPLMALMARVYPGLATKRSCPECLMDDLPGSATRCKYCCSSLPPLTSKKSRLGTGFSAGSSEVDGDEVVNRAPAGASVAPVTAARAMGNGMDV